MNLGLDFGDIFKKGGPNLVQLVNMLSTPYDIQQDLSNYTLTGPSMFKILHSIFELNRLLTNALLVSPFPFLILFPNPFLRLQLHLRLNLLLQIP